MNNTTNNSQEVLARHEDLVVQELPDEVLVYDLKQHKAHCLNKTASFIWQHCDGQTSVPEIAGLLKQESGSPVNEEVVWYAIDKLGKADLLTEKFTSPVQDGLSRRRMIRRLGAVLVLPTVVSIIAPTAVQAASVIVTSRKIACGQCINQQNPRDCVEDTCCTGQCSGGPQKECICVSNCSAPLVVGTCQGPLCLPATAANPCSGQGQPPNPNPIHK